MLIKRSERQARRSPLAGSFASQIDSGPDRRSFLRRSGLAAGGLAALGALTLGSIQKATAGPPSRSRRQRRKAQEHVHPLLCGLLGHSRGLKRSVDRPGAGF